MSPSSRVLSGAASMNANSWSSTDGRWCSLVHLLVREEEPNKDEVRKVQSKGSDQCRTRFGGWKGYKSVHSDFEGHCPTCGVWDHSRAMCLLNSSRCLANTCFSVNAGDYIRHLQTCAIFRQCVGEGDLWFLVTLLDMHPTTLISPQKR